MLMARSLFAAGHPGRRRRRLAPPMCSLTRGGRPRVALIIADLNRWKLRSGSMGGVVEACCLQPIDVIKTRLQLDKVGKYHGKRLGHRACRRLVGQGKGRSLKLWCARHEHRCASRWGAMGLAAAGGQTSGLVGQEQPVALIKSIAQTGLVACNIL
jgi:hypothetical protein